MTTFLLIRHGLHVLGGDTIAGRQPGVPLSPDGQVQADHLADRLSRVSVDAIYCSPIERTLQTAQPLAERQGLAVQSCDDLLEIDFGDWTGAALADLRGLDHWTRWNSFRSGHRAPNGESMVGVQARIISRILHLGERHPDQCVALVSHGDVIKAAVAYFLGVPLDLCQRIEISTASISVIVFAELGPYVLCVNSVGALEDLPGWGS